MSLTRMFVSTAIMLGLQVATNAVLDLLERAGRGWPLRKDSGVNVFGRETPDTTDHDFALLLVPLKE